MIRAYVFLVCALFYELNDKLLVKQCHKIKTSKRYYKSFIVFVAVSNIHKGLLV